MAFLRGRRRIHHQDSKDDGNNNKIPLAQMAGEAADAAVKRIGMNNNQVVPVSSSSVHLLRRRGRGAYCNVYEASLTTTIGDDEEQQKFAVKRLRPQAMKNNKRWNFVSAAVDLASEAAILSHLLHPNIIQVRGIAAGPVEKSVASPDGFFVVLELLETTLTDQITLWGCSDMDRKGNQERKRALNERLMVALQLARAIEYLHSQNIVHRDIKSDNVGMDANGVVKLFDFGLAVKTAARPNGRPHLMREVAGTRNYMAPEMALRRPYDQSVDVYSFGVLLWELCSMEVAFEGYSTQTHMHRVVKGGDRPRLPFRWSRPLKSLVRNCWSHDAKKRPSMSEVVQQLEKIVKAGKQ